jgi:hypothetical protein
MLEGNAKLEFGLFKKDLIQIAHCTKIRSGP